MIHSRRPDGSVGMALVLPALTDCRWCESLLVHSGVSSATRRKATGADQKKRCHVIHSATCPAASFLIFDIVRVGALLSLPTSSLTEVKLASWLTCAFFCLLLVIPCSSFVGLVNLKGLQLRCFCSCCWC